MRFTRVGMLIGLGALSYTVAVARAQTNEQKPKLTDAELQVMAKLHHVNQMEMDIGKVAAERARSADVKAFAARLVKDHTQADAKLTELAKKRDVTIPEPTAKDDAEKKQMDDEKTTMDRLKQLEGEEFDREFATAMVAGHTNALKLVTEAKNQVKDPQLLALVKSMEPALKKHLAAATKLAGKGKDQKSSNTKQ